MNFSKAEKLITLIESLLTGNEELYKESWAEVKTAKAVLYCHNEHFNPVPAIFNEWLPKMSGCPDYVIAVMKMAKTFYSLSEYDYDTASHEVGDILNLLEEPTLAMSHTYGACLRALVLYNEGALEQAFILLNADKAMILTRVDPGSDAVHMLESILGALSYSRGELESAQTLLQSGYKTERTLASVEMMLVIFPARVRQLVRTKRPHEALKYLIKTQTRARDKRWLRLEACVLHERVKMLIDVGSAVEAESLLHEWNSKNKKMDFPSSSLLHYVDECLAMVNVRLSLASGDGVKSAVIVKSLIDDARRKKRVMREIELWILLGRIYAESRLISEAKQALLKALERDRDKSVVQLFRDEGVAVLDLLRVILIDLKTVDESVRDLISCQHVEKIVAPLKQDKISEEPKIKPALIPGSDAFKMVESLTRRELATLELLVEGMSNKEIANKLCIGLNTVKTHLHFSYGKLGVTRRTQAVRRLKEMGVFE